MKANIAVIGLGTIGSLALAAVAAAHPQQKIIGIDQFGPVHTHGSFSGESRAFRVAVHEGDKYVPLLLRARHLWKSLQARVGRTLLIETGVLSIGTPDCASIRTTLREAEANDLPHQVLTHAELHAQYPQHDLDPDDMGFMDLLGGGLRPELAVLSALELARSEGAQFLTGSPVTDVATRPDGVHITVGDEIVIADRVIVAAGSWSRELLPELDGLIRVAPLSLTWFAPHHIDQFTADRFPVFLRDRGDDHLFGVPTLDGLSIKMAAGDRWGRCDSVAEVPQRVPRVDLIEIGRIASNFIPDLNPEPVRATMHHDGYTADRTPIIDASADGRIITLAGMSGHGFKFSPLYASWAAELVAGHIPEMYDPSVFNLRAHANASVGASS